MKTYHYCETCGKRFESAEEAIACENAHEKEKLRKKVLEENKLERSKEIERLLQSFINDYNELPSMKLTGDIIDNGIHVRDRFPLFNLLFGM
jgi:hypothetical protein